MRGYLLAMVAVAVGLGGGPGLAADVEMLLESGDDTLGNPVHYPEDGAPMITSVLVTIAPAECTGWHKHPVPTMGYMLAGMLTISYETGEERRIGGGDAIIEAQDTRHQGCNNGEDEVRIIVFYAGAEGQPVTIAD